jgi:CHASE1-domain containing sensor protein
MKRLLPATVFVVVVLLGAGMTWIVNQAIRETAESQFHSLATKSSTG